MYEVLNSPKIYTLVKKIAKGGEGEVYLGYDKLTDPSMMRPLKIKFLNSENSDLNFLQTTTKEECRKRLVFPRFYGVERFGETFAYIYDYIPGSDLTKLMNLIESIEVGDLWFLALGILSEIESFHQNSLFHGDVKLCNFILGEDGKIYLIDSNPCSEKVSFEYIKGDDYRSVGKGVVADYFAASICIKKILKKSNFEIFLGSPMEQFLNNPSLRTAKLLSIWIKEKRYGRQVSPTLIHLATCEDFSESTEATVMVKRESNLYSLVFLMLLLFFLFIPRTVPKYEYSGEKIPISQENAKQWTKIFEQE